MCRPEFRATYRRKRVRTLIAVNGNVAAATHYGHTHVGAYREG